MSWSYLILLNSNYPEQSLRNLLQKTWLIPRKVIHFLRINQRVLVNQQYQSMNTLVKPGDQITLTFIESDFDTPNPPFDDDSSLQPEILFENQDVLVVNKPAGIKTHSNQPHELGSMINHLQNYLHTNGTGQAYNVHRLDQQTSGALLVAKNPVVVPILNRQISTKIIHRTYLCVVRGQLPNDKGTINESIGLDPNDQRKRKINGAQALTAVTHYEVLKEDSDKSLLKIDLETGRTHQIRVHLASLGYPIVGDPLYNLDVEKVPMQLHAWKINFPIPFSLKQKIVTAPIPLHFQITP